MSEGGPVAPPIADHGLIGDLHTAALVALDGSIDWCCVPRFDAPSVFAALLDPERGGRCRIGLPGAGASEQRYLPATNILETSFHALDAGVAQVTDFMPVGPSREGHTEIHRRVTCLRAPVTVEVLFEPRFDYGLRPPRLVRRTHGVLATDLEDDVATISADPEVPWVIEETRARAQLLLHPGESRWFVLRFDDDEVHPLAAYASQQRLDETAAWWDRWSSALQYTGPYRREVERSALALKLCCYEPSGAVVAAPTTSLPEEAGGARNWDYRFAWLRDSAFVLYALDRSGFEAEVTAFLRFLKRVCRFSDGRHVQIMYGVDGRRDLPERTLDHLAGYRGARPVRVGNGAAGQFQLDVYGELLETLAIWHRDHPMSEGLWNVVRGLIDWTADHWREPDFSIWEARQEARHYVYSKVMAWAALDRGVELATQRGLEADVERWRREAGEVHAEVMERGWDAARGTFVQAYDEPQLDAAVLVIPKIGFLPRHDPRVASTLAAIRRELATASEELIYRYRAPDGLAGAEEGAFIVCCFWVVQNLALTGDFAEAERLFRHLLRRANHVGLLAEEIDPGTGEQLGNFPQALSHAALINTACILERLRPKAEAPPAAAPS